MGFVMYKNMKRSNSKKEISIKEAFVQFISEKRAEGKIKTCFGYEKDLEYFFTFCNIDKSSQCSILDKNLVNSFVMQQKQRSIKDVSINHYLSSIRCFLYWCMRNEYLYEYEIKLLKTQDNGVKYYTEEELSKLLVKPTKDTQFPDYRSFVIIAFIMATGARLGTVCNVKISDVDFDSHDIKYAHTKNKKAQVVPMSYDLEKILKDYLRTWERTSDKDWLFCDVGENQLTESACRQAINKYCKRKNVEPKSVHAFRASFARGFIKAGGQPFYLQKMLGHSTLAMTRHYCNLFDEDLKDNYDSFCPLSSMIKENSRKQTIKRA